MERERGRKNKEKRKKEIKREGGRDRILGTCVSQNLGSTVLPACLQPILIY